MTVVTETNAVPDVARFYAALKSVHEFDNAEVLPRVKSFDSPSARQHCFIAGYYRAVTTVRSLLRLDNPSHFQAISSLSRTLFELAVDIRLVDVINESIPKIYAFAKLERLRSAEKMLAFGKGFGAGDDLAVYEAFVASNKKDIQETCAALWPNVKLKNLKHWSLLSVADQADAAGSIFPEMYQVNYKPLSWQVHSGLAGVIDLEKEAFQAMCGVALKIALDCFADVLKAMITEFKLIETDPHVEIRLRLAVLLPFTDSEDEAAALEKALMS